jgi:GTP pyrophosphokinase
LHLGKFGPADWERAVREYGCRQGEELLARIGFGKYAPRVVLARLTAAPLGEEARPTAPRRALAGLRETVRRVFRLRGEALSLRQPDLLLYRARCCNPIHGEEVVGYITRGRGIAVHTRICPNVQNLLYDSERRIEVEWAESEAETYPVRLAVTTTDRPGLLTEISGIIADDQCNIRHAEAHSDPSSGRAVIELIFDVREIKQFERIRAAINKVPDVHNVTRLLRV